MSTVSVKPIVPHELVVAEPMSTSAHILRKRQVEIQPTETSAFSYNGNDRIVINLSSQTEFLDANNSFVRGDIQFDFQNATGHLVNAALDEGGITAACKVLELRTQSGVLIEKWDQANRLYAVISNATQSRDFVESMMGDQLDSVGYDSAEVDHYSNAASEELTGLQVYTAARALPGAKSLNDTMEPCEFCLKVPLGFFNMREYVPLMLIKQGLQLIIELDRPQFAVNSHAVTTSTVTNYTISNVRYVAQMVTAEESVMNIYRQRFDNEGLHYTFESFRHKRKTIAQATDGSVSLSQQFSLRSARAVYSIIQSSILSHSASDASLNYPSISTFLRTGLTEYQYRSGSEEYPNHVVKLKTRPDGTNATNTKMSFGDAFSQLMLATNQYNSKLHQVRFLPYQWNGQYNAAAQQPIKLVEGESSKLILATNLSGGNDAWTGIDLSINPLDLEMNFEAVSNAAFGDRIVNTWVLHDVMVSISKQNGIVVRK